MKKRRLAVYAALVIIFALACVIQIAPSLIAKAVTADPAAIGTASLSDAGNTVFIRTAKFTIDGRDYYAAGYTVADAATGDDPAEGVNLDTLTPITAEKPLTGTLDKNIYVCKSDPADLYVKDLKLASGHKIYTDGSGLNFLGGKMEADSIETTGFINLASADVTVNSDLTGFSYIFLHVSKDSNSSIASFNTPSSLTVNGNISNTGNMYNAAISAANGSKVKVTGSITTEHALVFNNSTLDVGGDISIAQNHGGMCLNLNSGSAAVVGGKITTNDWIHINRGSSLTADSIECTLLGCLSGSSLDVKKDVTVNGSGYSAGWFDLYQLGSGTVNIGGNVSCYIFSAPASGGTVHIGGSLEIRGESYTENCNFDIDGSINKTGGGVFLFKNSTVDIAGDVNSANNLDFDSSTATVHGNVTDKGLCPVRNTTLVIEGDGNFVWFDPMKSSNVTVKGNLTSTAGFLMANTGATLKVEKDINCNDFCVYGGGTIETVGDLNATYVNVNNNSNLLVGGDLNSTGLVDVTGGAKCTVNGDTNAQTVGVYNNSTLNVDGDVNATSWITSEGSGAMTVGGDLSYNSNCGRIVGTVSVGGNFVNSAAKQQSSTYFNGLYVPGKLTVGGDVHMGDLLLNYNNYNENIAVTGDIQAYRVADIIVESDGTYVVEGVEQDPSKYIVEGSERRISYTVPFNRRIIPVQIDGELYAVDITDLSTKKYDPIEGAYNLTFDTDGGAFVDGYTPDAVYLPGKGAALPTESEIKKQGFVFDGWYNEAVSATAPLTAIPDDATGDLTLTAHWIECDHKNSSEQPTCTEPAICSICEAELLALGHTWNEPAWNWDDVEHPTYSTTCSVCEDGEASGEADSVEPDAHEATVDADGYTDYTATVTLGSQTFSDTHRVTDDGSMLAKRKAAFEEYKDEQNEAAGEKALEGDSEQCAQLIEEAKAAIDALEYDEDKSLEENKAAVDAIIAQLEDDLAEHRKEYTATFIGNGTTAGTVKFTIDTESIDEPAVPEKTGYTGEWEDYTLGAEDITVEAIYTAIEYTAKFVNENGETVEEIPYTVETENITPPAVPEKKGYTGEWEDYTLEIGGITVKPVYTNITGISLNKDGIKETTGYKENQTFKADATDLPEGAEIHWFVNGEDVGTGSSYKVEDPTDDYTVQAKVIDSDGTVLAETETVKVHVKNGFFDKLRWFINDLLTRIFFGFIGKVC